MIQIDVLNRGKRIFNPIEEDARLADGIYDLTVSSISYENVTLRFTSTYLVPEDYQMRPDLISRATLGSDALVGSLMKSNSISNPFAIGSDILLLVPNESDVENTFFKKQEIQKSQSNSPSIQNTFRKSQQNKVFEVSSSRKAFLEAQRKAKSPAAPLPPNMLQPGQTTVTTQNGSIFLGNDTGGGSNLPSNNT
jgi:hypothetical protein